MNLSKNEIQAHFDKWLTAWNGHNLEGVMKFIHDEITFENWNGQIISGKRNLEKAWSAWFLHHGNFQFIEEDVFIDEQEQKLTFTWLLKWPSFEKKYIGKPEKRKGVDILYLKEGKVFKKDTYSKTVIEIDAKKVLLSAI